MRGFLVGSWVAAAVVSAAAQAAEPRSAALTFPTTVDVVNLSVSVLDGRDKFVTDLQLGDFAIFENGVRQEPTLFAQDDLPISMVLLLDMSASMALHLDVVRRAASRMVERLRPQDQAQVVQFSDRPSVIQDFTSDPEKLLGAIRATHPGGGTALHNALYVTLKEVAAVRKAEEIRRRAIVLLSDGDDTTSVVTDDQVLEAARACEISVYSIMLGRPRGALPGSEQANYLLRSLARESGGQAYFPSGPGELGRLYDRIAHELRSQYNIGYVSSNAGHDGSWRQILVMAPQHENLMIRHRLGYYAVPDAPLPKAKRSAVSPAAVASAAGAAQP
jgi:Ca-activated chloride channel family protein